MCTNLPNCKTCADCPLGCTALTDEEQEVLGTALRTSRDLVVAHAEEMRSGKYGLDPERIANVLNLLLAKFGLPRDIIYRDEGRPFPPWAKKLDQPR